MLLHSLDIPMANFIKGSEKNKEFFMVTLIIYVIFYILVLAANMVIQLGAEEKPGSAKKLILISIVNLWNILIKTPLLLFLFFIPAIFNTQANESWDSFNGSTIAIGVFIFCFILITFIILSDNTTSLSEILKGVVAVAFERENARATTIQRAYRAHTAATARAAAGVVIGGGRSRLGNLASKAEQGIGRITKNNLFNDLIQSNIFKKFNSFISMFKPLAILFLIYTILQVRASKNINIEYKPTIIASVIIAAIVLSIIMRLLNKIEKSKDFVSNNLLMTIIMTIVQILPGVNIATTSKKNNIASDTSFNVFCTDNTCFSVSGKESLLYILYFSILFMIVFLKDNIFIKNLGLTIPIMFLFGIIFIIYGLLRAVIFDQGKGMNLAKSTYLYAAASAARRTYGDEWKALAKTYRNYATAPSRGKWKKPGKMIFNVIKYASTFVTFILNIVFFALILKGTWVYKKVECVLKNFINILKKILYLIPYHTLISLIVVLFLLFKYPKYSIFWIIGFFLFISVSFKVFLFVMIPLMLILFLVIRFFLYDKINSYINTRPGTNKYKFLSDIAKWIALCFIINPKELKDQFGQLQKDPIGRSTKLLLLFEIVVVLLIVVVPIVLKQMKKHDGVEILKGPQYLNSQITKKYSEIRNDAKNTIEADGQEVRVYDSAKEASRTYNFALSMWIYINKFDKSTNEAYAFTSTKKRADIMKYLGQIQIKYNNQTDNLEIYYKKNGTLTGEKIYQTVDFKFQKWNNIVLNYSNGTLDVFINDKLMISKSNILFSRTHDIANKQISIGTTNNKYNLIGGVKDVYYYNTNISRNKIHLIYNF